MAHVPVAARQLAADAMEQLPYQSESSTWRNAYPLRAKELRLGAPKPPMPSPFGTLWFAPDALLVAGGVIPASGMQTTSIAFPPQPTGSAVVVQAVAWDGVATLVVGGAARVMVD